MYKWKCSGSSEEASWYRGCWRGHPGDEGGKQADDEGEKSDDRGVVPVSTLPPATPHLCHAAAIAAVLRHQRCEFTLCRIQNLNVYLLNTSCTKKYFDMVL